MKLLPQGFEHLTQEIKGAGRKIKQMLTEDAAELLPATERHMHYAA